MATSRRKVLIVLAVLVVSAVVASVVWATHDRPPKGFITGLLAVDADRAIVAVRAADNETARGWIMLMDARRGGPVWWTELPKPPITRAAQSLTVGGGIVTVRYGSEVLNECPTGTLGVSLETGKVQWRTDFARCEDEVLRATTLADGDQLFEFVAPAAGGGSVIAIERSTGRIQWTQTIPQIHRASFATKKWLVVPSELQMNYVNRDDGSIRSFPAGFTHCLLGDEIFTFGLTATSAHGLHATNVDTLEDRVVSPDFVLPVDPSAKLDYGVATSCGTYGGNLVFVFGWTSSIVVGVSPASGAAQWTIPLPGRARTLDSDGRGSGWSGPLPRFAPIAQHDVDEPHGERLLGLDLEEHRIVKRGVDTPCLFSLATVWSHDELYLSSRYGQGILGRFDGTTGKLGALARIPEYMTGLTPQSLAAGRLWLYSDSRSASWAVLDATTLHAERRGTKDLVIEDIKGETASVLGIE